MKIVWATRLHMFLYYLSGMNAAMGLNKIVQTNDCLFYGEI